MNLKINIPLEVQDKLDYLQEKLKWDRNIICRYAITNHLAQSNKLEIVDFDKGDYIIDGHIMFGMYEDVYYELIKSNFNLAIDAKIISIILIHGIQELYELRLITKSNEAFLTKLYEVSEHANSKQQTR